MFAKLVQPENAELPMPVTLVGIVMLAKLVQPENAASSILVTLEGIVMLAKLVQPENALLPMLVTPEGIVMFAKLVQPENAELPMLLPPIITTIFNDAGTEEFPPKIKPKFVLEVPFRVLPTNGIVILVNPLQPLNTELPILVTLEGRLRFTLYNYCKYCNLIEDASGRTLFIF